MQNDGGRLSMGCGRDARDFSWWAVSAGTDTAASRLTARRKTGAVITIAGAFGGLGGVAINLAFRQSYQSAHNARPALIGFLAFYAVCVAVTGLAGRRHATLTAAVPTEAAVEAAA